MWKKRVCALVVFAMLVNLAFTALPVFGFSDTQNHWAADAIDRFSDKGYISGLEDGSFLPDKAVTRAEFAQIIMKVQGGSAPGGPSPFSDVSQGDWYCGAVLWAYENAFVNGYDSGFYPNDFITRQDAAVILGRVYTMMSAQMSVIEGFSDYGEIADYSKAYFVRLVGNGFLKGYDDNTVRPRASITRAEAVTIIDRILQKQDESNSYIKDVTYPEKTKSPSGSIGGSGGSGSGGSGSSGGGSGSKPTATPDSGKPVLSGGKYQIKTAKNLVWLLSRANRSQVSAMMDGDFVLTADIDLSGYYFTSPQDAGKIPDGKTYVSFSPLSGFTGSFDGGMHKISGFTLYLPKTDGAAMFLENRGEIKNLLLLKSNVTGKNNSAILASQNSGEIDNVRVTGSLSGADCAGGIAAVCDGKISRASADVALSAQSKAGAICGQGKNIKTCIAQGTVTVQGENAGGIVGVATGDIRYNIAKLSGISGDNNIGGIAGLANGLLSFNLCQSSVISAAQQTPSVHAVCGLQSVLPQNNFTLAKTILMAAGNPVAYAPVAENGTQITKEQGDSESFYAENGFYGEGGFQKSAQGLPAIDTAAITADEAQAAPGFVDGSLSYVGEGSGEKKAMITASLSYAGIIKWASCPAGTQNPNLVFLESDEILRTGTSEPFEITLSAAEASDVYLKAVSVDGIEGSEVLCIPNVMPQMFASGKGTGQEPYVIATAGQLGRIGYVAGETTPFTAKHFVLGQSIDLSGVSWQSIPAFSGTFDGKSSEGYVISNLSGSHLGLFEKLVGGQVRNLVIQNANVTASGIMSGILAGQVTNGSVVENCAVLGATLNSGDWTGLITGDNDKSLIQNTIATGTLNASGSQVGGICGANFFGSIANCYVKAAIAAGGDKVGGIAGIYQGNQENNSYIKNCYITGSVSGTGYAGGIAGDCTRDGWPYIISGCVSLLDSVSGAVTGRITSAGQANLSGNKAYGDMGTSPVSNAAGKDGETISFAAATSFDTYTSAGFSADIWQMPESGYNLPILKTIPASLQAFTPLEDEGGEPEVNKNGLRELYNTALTLAEEEYTPETWAAFIIARNAAKTVLDDDAATQPQVDSAKDELQAKMTALAPNPDEPQPPEGFTAVRTAGDLAALAGQSGNFYLMNHLDLSGQDFASITGFSGTFDGGGHTISGLHGPQFLGLFGTRGGGDAAITVKNLIIDGAQINSGENMVGAVIRNITAGCEVVNCAVVNAQISANMNCGGIVGFVDNGAVRGCLVANTTIANQTDGQGASFGGICGTDMFGTVENCYFNGTIDAKSATDVGGICGASISSNEKMIKNCYAKGEILGTGDAYGGILGGVSGDWAGITISGCAAFLSAVPNTANAGRIIGRANAYDPSNIKTVQLVQNIAFGSAGTSPTSDAAGKDGETISFAAATSFTTYTAIGFSEGIWNMPADTGYNLPVLSCFGDALQSFAPLE